MTSPDLSFGHPLVELLAVVAIAARGYADSEPARLWRLGNPHGQALWEALNDLEAYDDLDPTREWSLYTENATEEAADDDR